jgi:AraC-like DNA-binding protein
MDDLPFIPVVYGVKIVEMMEEEHLQVDYILRECGMSRAIFQNPESMLSIRQTRVLLGRYLGLSSVSYPAIRYGRRLDLITHGILGFVFSWRGNFRDMLAMLLDYLRVRFPMMSINMQHEKDYFALRIESHEGIKMYEDFLIQAFLASLYELGSKVTKNIVIHCRDDLFADRKNLHQVIPVAVQGGHNFNEIRYYSSEVKMRAHDDPEVVADSHDDPFLEHGVVVRLRSYLLAHIGRNQSAEEVAAHLGMSERTLRRRLADSGMSFNRIRLDVRMQVAERYLKTSDMSIERIATMVGYSDQATFTRAFGDWSDMTPLAVRRKHRRKPEAPVVQLVSDSR